MKKGDKLIGTRGTYTVLHDFAMTGGMSKVSFASMDGMEFFIKEFLAPKYPTDAGKAGSPATIERKRERCKAFEAHHKELNERIATKTGSSGLGGNLVCAYDFFRNGTTYYKVSEKIDIHSISIVEIASLPDDLKLLIMKTITHSLKMLHDLDIVHGDLKPDNVLIKETKVKTYTTKLIDFDNSYFSGRPPENSEDAVGDQIYYSPELANYIMGKGGVKPADLTTKSDIFALGILFCQYLTGALPVISSKYKYVWESVLEGVKPSIKGSASLAHIIELVYTMLSKSPNDRPDITAVFSILKGLDVASAKESATIEKPSIKTEPIKSVEKHSRAASEESPPVVGLRGKLFEKLKDTPEERPTAEPKLRGKLMDKLKEDTGTDSGSSKLRGKMIDKLDGGDKS